MNIHDEKNTRPFDLNSAKSGAPYAQRNGLAARIGIWDVNGFQRLVGVATYGNGMESTMAWKEDGTPQSGCGVNALVMLPLGYCEGKPVFVGDELVVKHNGLTYYASAGDRKFEKSVWKLTPPPPPKLNFLFTAMTNDEFVAAALENRFKLQEYWKALDDFKYWKALDDFNEVKA